MVGLGEDNALSCLRLNASWCAACLLASCWFTIRQKESFQNGVVVVKEKRVERRMEAFDAGGTLAFSAGRRVPKTLSEGRPLFIFFTTSSSLFR